MNMTIAIHDVEIVHNIGSVKNLSHFCAVAVRLSGEFLLLFYFS